MPASTDTPTPFIDKLFRATTNTIRLLPDFIIIGTQRGGTTSLYNYLAEHPGIGAASIKEVHFFDTPRFKRGLTWYRAHFPSVMQKYYVEYIKKHNFITGEASPYYLFYPFAPRRVAMALPHVKIIVMLRNPIDRAYSHFYHEKAGGYEKLSSFEDAIDAEEERLANELQKMREDESYHSYNLRHFSYLARGIYVDQLRAWLNLFPKEQVLILKSEDFYADPRAALKHSHAFLGLSDTDSHEQEPVFKKYNDTKSPKMEDTTRKRLIQYFESHNERLYNYLGTNFGWDK